MIDRRQFPLLSFLLEQVRVTSAYAGLYDEGFALIQHYNEMSEHDLFVTEHYLFVAAITGLIRLKEDGHAHGPTCICRLR